MVVFHLYSPLPFFTTQGHQDSFLIPPQGYYWLNTKLTDAESSEAINLPLWPNYCMEKMNAWNADWHIPYNAITTPK